MEDVNFLIEVRQCLVFYKLKKCRNPLRETEKSVTDLRNKFKLTLLTKVKMTKDRLHEMKKLMEAHENQDGGENNAKEKSTPLITFFEHARAIKLEIEDLKNKVNDLKILLSDNQQWTNAATRKEIEHKIERQKLLIGNLAKIIRNNLKSMKSSSWDSKSVSVIKRIKDVQLNTIRNELNEILKDYLQCLVEHRERAVKILADMLEVKGDKITDIEALLEEGKIAIFTNNLLIGDVEEKYRLREAEDAHNGILKLESSILEIRNLFNELALIVDIQAGKVDEVEKAVDENLNKVESGKAKLTSASKKKRKYRYKKLIVALICGGVILIILVLLTII